VLRPGHPSAPDDSACSASRLPRGGTDRAGDRGAGIGFAIAIAIAQRLLADGLRVVVHHHTAHDAEQPWGADDLVAAHRPGRCARRRHRGGAGRTLGREHALGDPAGPGPGRPARWSRRRTPTWPRSSPPGAGVSPRTRPAWCRGWSATRDGGSSGRCCTPMGLPPGVSGGAAPDRRCATRFAAEVSAGRAGTAAGSRPGRRARTRPGAGPRRCRAPGCPGPPPR
jgi:hypothetical protein